MELLEGWKCGTIGNGKVVAGYDTCHCLARIYCFTAFMHFILLCVRRHVRALKFLRLACMPNLYCISCVFGD